MASTRTYLIIEDSQIIKRFEVPNEGFPATIATAYRDDNYPGTILALVVDEPDPDLIAANLTEFPV